MNMHETEIDILKDLQDLGDDMSQYLFLLQCAKDGRSYPEEYRDDDHLVRDCQMKTWIRIKWKNDRCVFDADSESLLVRGALALLQEIYDDRTQNEAEGYSCNLMEEEIFTRHFNRDQLKGLRVITQML